MTARALENLKSGSQELTNLISPAYVYANKILSVTDNVLR